MGSPSTMRLGSLIAVVLFALLLSQVYANDLDKAMYTRLMAPVPCTRWLNSTGQIGCTTSADGVYGVFWPVETQEALDSLSSSSSLPSETLLVMRGDLLTPASVKKLEAVKKVKGVIVLSGLPTQAYSETGIFPGAETTTAGEPGSYQWNMANHDLLHYSYKWPMWSLDVGDSHSILETAKTNRDEGTTKGALLKQFMYAYKDSTTCLHLGFCEPVGGHTVWGLLPSPNVTAKPLTSQTQVVVALSRMDALSLFAGDAVGAEADMSGLAATLAALTTLAGYDNIEEINMPDGSTRAAFHRNSLNPADFKYPILFALFDAEHWGYAGSTRFLNDWTHFDCLTWANEEHTECETPKYSDLSFQNLRFSNLRSIFEMRQVGLPQPSDQSHQLFVHQHRHNFNTPLIQGILQTTAKSYPTYALNVSISTASTSTPGLPPSSAFTFVDAILANSSTASIDNIVVIADHNEHYINKFYGSRFDLSTNVDSQLVADAATVLARSLYASATEESIDYAFPIRVNVSLVKQWLTCLTFNDNCFLAQIIMPTATSNTFNRPVHYNGPYFDWSTSKAGKLIRDWLLFISRNQALDAAIPKCTASDSNNCTGTQECVLGLCISTAFVHYHESYSTGIARNPTGGWKVVDASKPNWVEPYWDPPTFELILVGSYSKHAGFLAGAIFLTLFFTTGILFLKNKVSKSWEATY